MAKRKQAGPSQTLRDSAEVSAGVGSDSEISELRKKCLPLFLRSPNEREFLNGIYQELKRGEHDDPALSKIIGVAIHDSKRLLSGQPSGVACVSESEELLGFFERVARALVERDAPFFRKVAGILDFNIKRAADDSSEAFWAHQLLGVYLNPNNEPTEQPGTKWALKEAAMFQVAWEDVFLRSTNPPRFQINPKYRGLPIYPPQIQSALDKQLDCIRKHHQPEWKRVFPKAGLDDLPPGNKGGRPPGKKTGFSGPQGKGS